MKPDLNHVMSRDEFDPDQTVAEQEAYSDGMLDREMGNTSHAKRYPEELREAYIDGYKA